MKWLKIVLKWQVKLKMLVLLALHPIKLVKNLIKIDFIDIKLFLNGYHTMTVYITHKSNMCVILIR